MLAGAPEWYSFEHEAWAIGEEIRQWLSANLKLKEEKRIKEGIFTVIQNQNLRRGRESFVMLLGYKNAADMAERVAVYLDDDDISGHALDTLHKMKIYGYKEKASTLLTSEKTWVRNVAKKYIQKAVAEPAATGQRR